VIRGLSTGDVVLKDWLKILSKELLVGLSLGVVLGLVAYFRGLFVDKNHTEIALVISGAMVILVVWANIVGALFPLLFYKLKLDPAVISSPFISTFVDVTGLLIYFNIAHFVLGL